MSKSALSDIKHEATAPSVSSDKEHRAPSLLNGLTP